ncbi:hypothetical protein HDV00_006748 [Rhizophlyctis rosea]|nr:hypothetical protein HDV00_006748 [Rhizophlyctis rosea]
MYSLNSYPIPVTIQATVPGTKDFIHTAHIYPQTTTTDLLFDIVPAVFGPDAIPDLFRLYEAEVTKEIESEEDPTHPPTDPTSPPTRRTKPLVHIHRKLIRPLLPTELPYFFLLSHPPSPASNPSSTTTTTILYLKPELPAPSLSPFTILRREQVKQLPEDVVRDRLVDVEREEREAVDSVKERYDELRRLVEERLKGLG